MAREHGPPGRTAGAGGRTTPKQPPRPAALVTEMGQEPTHAPQQTPGMSLDVAVPMHLRPG
jgi:hypothetical protein